MMRTDSVFSSFVNLNISAITVFIYIKFGHKVTKNTFNVSRL